MLKIRIRYTLRELVLVLFFYLFMLQHVLESQFSVFKYVDECVALLGMLFASYKILRSGKMLVRKKDWRIVVALAAFAAAGLLANALYRYQPLKAVLKDLFACLKFFLCIVAGYELFRYHELEEQKCVIVGHAKFATTVMFGLFLLDLWLNIFPSPEMRYGIRTVQLMYNHPTYLASATVFLLGIFTIFYKHDNNSYIFCCIILLIFTLRSKAIAGAAVYTALFFFVLYRRKKIKFIHVIVLGILALVVAWDQINYYYIELAGGSARAVLTQTSLEILIDFFPIGTGFGTFASNVAAEFYSPVYFEYGINLVHGLTEEHTAFGSDTFWPIILGQTGFIGTFAYLTAQATLFFRVIKVRMRSNPAYMAGIFLFSYLIISSTSESAFCNAMSAPLAMLIGGILTLENRGKESVVESRKCKYEKSSVFNEY